jgi:hypothetical protein
MEMDDQGFAGIGKGFNNLDGLVFQFSPLTSVTLSNVILYICLHASPLVCTSEDHLPDVKPALKPHTPSYHTQVFLMHSSKSIGYY